MLTDVKWFLPQNKIYINFLGFEAALASSQRVAPPSLSSLYGNTILAEPCALLSNATLSTNKQNKKYRIKSPVVSESEGAGCSYSWLWVLNLATLPVLNKMRFEWMNHQHEKMTKHNMYWMVWTKAAKRICTLPKMRFAYGNNISYQAHWCTKNPCMMIMN